MLTPSAVAALRALGWSAYKNAKPGDRVLAIRYSNGAFSHVRSYEPAVVIYVTNTVCAVRYESGAQLDALVQVEDVYPFTEGAK